MPKKQEFARILDEYKTEHHKKLFVERTGSQICGILGIEQHAGELEITHIAVLPDCRKKGIGRKMINHIINIAHCKTIIAETDEDEVEFYRKCGFKIMSSDKKYPGITRYKCLLDLS